MTENNEYPRPITPAPVYAEDSVSYGKPPKQKKSKRKLWTGLALAATLFVGIGIGSAGSAGAVAEVDELETSMANQTSTWQKDLELKNARLDEIEAKYAAKEKELVAEREKEPETVVPDACFDLTDDIDTLLTITSEYIALIHPAAEAGASQSASEVNAIIGEMDALTVRVDELAPILVENRKGCTGE